MFGRTDIQYFTLMEHLKLMCHLKFYIQVDYIATQPYLSAQTPENCINLSTTGSVRGVFKKYPQNRKMLYLSVTKKYLFKRFYKVVLP